MYPKQTIKELSTPIMKLSYMGERLRQALLLPKSFTEHYGCLLYKQTHFICKVRIGNVAQK